MSPRPQPGREFVLTLSCPDQAGLVHAVTTFLVGHSGNILESQQFDDRLQSRFFMRLHFDVSDPDVSLEELRTGFGPVAEEYRITWQLQDASVPTRTLIMVSKFGHCLNDLLFRTSAGALNIEIPAIVSNHRDLEPLAQNYGIPFHHIPVTQQTKAEAEARLLHLVDELDIGQGARARRQACRATAHYVTSDLGEGPIIEQDVVRVDHSHAPDDLVTMGRDVEAQVLARAVLRDPWTALRIVALWTTTLQIAKQRFAQ
jgi:formyltetrahydrofolate deformylase